MKVFPAASAPTLLAMSESLPPRCFEKITADPSPLTLAIIASLVEETPKVAVVSLAEKTPGDVHTLPAASTAIALAPSDAAPPKKVDQIKCEPVGSRNP